MAEPASTVAMTGSVVTASWDMVATGPATSAPASGSDATPAQADPASPPPPASPAPSVAPAPDAPPAAPAAPAKPAANPPANPPAKTGGNPEIVVSGERNMKKIDPLMGVNKTSYQVMQKVDDMLVAPVANGYRKALPKPVRTALHNFFYNLTEPDNMVNYLLQLHPGKAFKTLERFGINSTIGLAGLIDVAKKKPFNIHYRPNGFGNTFGYWGIGTGPYLFLPLAGPTTLRDLIGTLMDQAFLPTVVGKPFTSPYYVFSSGVIVTLDYRVIIDEDLKKVRDSSSPYSSYRQIYLKTRFEEIEALHGRGPLAKGEVGEAPFAKPLYPEGNQPPPPASIPTASLTPSAPPPATDAIAPPAPVFITVPIVEPHAVVEPLPQGYRENSGS